MCLPSKYTEPNSLSTSKVGPPRRPRQCPMSVPSFQKAVRSFRKRTFHSRSQTGACQTGSNSLCVDTHVARFLSQTRAFLTRCSNPRARWRASNLAGPVGSAIQPATSAHRSRSCVSAGGALRHRSPKCAHACSDFRTGVKYDARGEYGLPNCRITRFSSAAGAGSRPPPSKVCNCNKSIQAASWLKP